MIVDAPEHGPTRSSSGKILLTHGLVAGRDFTVQAVGGTAQRLQAMRARPRYAASMLNPPFSILAERSGLRSLGFAVSALGPYQAIAGFVLRPWAQSNATILERYVRAHVEGLGGRWRRPTARRQWRSSLRASTCRRTSPP